MPNEAYDNSKCDWIECDMHGEISTSNKTENLVLYSVQVHALS